MLYFLDFSTAVPGPVRSLHVLSVSDTSVQVVWNSPVDVTEITSYEVSVSYWSDGQVLYQNSIDPTGSFLTWTVSNLSKFYFCT